MNVSFVMYINEKVNGNDKENFEILAFVAHCLWHS